MKELIKRLLPTPLLQATRKMLHPEVSQRHSPLVSRYRGNAESVLQCCISYNKYGGYCVPLSSIHRPATQKILSGEVWEPETLQFMSRHCGTGDLIHAGTYFGDFIPALSRACAPNAKVWAFEPNPENYRCALITTTLNNLHNVEITNAGLGSQEGSMPMLVADQTGRALGGASQLIESDSYVEEQIVRVKILKIDDVIPADRNISIIQLDVEGFEQPALAGAIATIKRCKPVLILENLPNEDWLSANILQLGYKVMGKVHANTILSILM